MPVISRKGQSMPASPIRKLVPYAEEAIRKGIKVYRLNIGQPDIKTPEIAIEAIKNINKPLIEYSHSAGNESYRKKLTSYYLKNNIEIDPANILITTGGSEAILFSILSIADPGDEIIVPEPFYANYYFFFVSSGVQMVPVPSRIENNFALPPIEDFKKLIGPKTKGIIICNPNNPTGYLYSKEELEKLGDIVKEYDLFLISDEVYREFCYDGHEHYSVLNLRDVDQHVIMVDSISKRYSACGVRIGTLISRNKDVIHTVLKFGQARLSPPGLGQIFAEAALDAPPEYFSEVHEEYKRRRNFLVNALNKIKGVVCPIPKGAFYAIAKLPVDNTDKFAQWMLSDFSYENQTVMLAPGSGFYASPGLGQQEVRIAYVLKMEDLKNAVVCLEKALQQYPGRID